MKILLIFQSRRDIINAGKRVKITYLVRERRVRIWMAAGWAPVAGGPQRPTHEGDSVPLGHERRTGTGDTLVRRVSSGPVRRSFCCFVWMLAL